MRTPDGICWTASVFPYSFWMRYLAVFEQVNVIARVRDCNELPSGAIRSDGEKISFVPLPHFVGPWQYLWNVVRVKRRAQSAAAASQAIILRVCTHTANLVEHYLSSSGHPFGVEVINDPYDMFSPGTLDTVLRPLLRWWFPRRLRAQCHKACSSAYVTEYTLQRRYPPAQGTFTTHYSSVELSDSAFHLPATRDPNRCRDVPRLVTVAPLGHLNKGTDVLIEAVEICNRNGLPVTLTVVGEGEYRARLEQQVQALHLREKVQFVGHAAGAAAVRGHLDQADVFVLPSRHEGLPRAMLEAMARAMPCIGSTVGGIPELLPTSDMVPPNNAPALASAICSVVTDPPRAATMAKRNYERARMYTDNVLNERRQAFYQAVRSATDEWLGRSVPDGTRSIRA